jgi:hypothetical protein
MSHRKLSVLGACAALLLFAASASATPISAGQQVSGLLSASDPQVQDGSFADSYEFQGRAGEHVQITMRSSAFDTYLLIQGPGDFSSFNDDISGSDRNSQIDVVLPANGAYRITATSYTPKDTGAYTLSLNDLGQQTVSASRALTLSRAQNGQLRTGDPQLPNTGEFSNTYTFHGRAGQHVDITMSSTEFDPYLIVRGPGVQEDNDDASPGDTSHSRVTVTLPQDGDYTIVATSYAAGMTGSYQLMVAPAGAESAQTQTAADVTGNGSPPLIAGQQEQGSLRQGDQQLTSGEFFDVYRFLGQRGQHVTIDMSSDSFHPYLILRPPTAQQQDNDGGAGRTAEIDATLPEDGEYVVMATSHASGESGDYHITLNTTDEGGSVAVSETPHGGGAATGPRLQLGRATQGNLRDGDTTLSSGQYADTWTFEGHEGQSVSFDLTSTAIDPYLIVASPSGEQRVNDDIDDSNRNSHIQWRLPEDGVYQVTATSYDAHETGVYTLRAAIDNAPAPEQRGGAGRVHAVIVGISDYGDPGANLQYTADDARNMEAALRREGVLTGDSVVLTDAQATIANVQAAFQRVAAQAGPADTFLFFYSGHGDQGDEGTAPDQADRRMEYIVLRDGEVSAETMGQWFKSVHARLGLIALDSCFSGGFRTVISRPGLMGLFSSEEDLTSGVALKFQAGGYLSYFLTQGLQGQADDDGNHIVTAGELSDYLWRKFAREVDNEESWTINHQRNYQRLVVDRGGVKVDDVVIALNN